MTHPDNSMSSSVMLLLLDLILQPTLSVLLNFPYTLGKKKQSWLKCITNVKQQEKPHLQHRHEIQQDLFGGAHYSWPNRNSSILHVKTDHNIRPL